MARAGKLGRQKETPLAKEVAERFTIYVNPVATVAEDPDQLQKRALPTLKQWHEDGNIKEMILIAVVFFIEQYPEISDPLSLQYAREQARLLAKYLLPELKQHIVLTANAVPQQVLTSLNDDFDDFADDFFIRNYVSYEEDYND